MSSILPKPKAPTPPPPPPSAPTAADASVINAGERAQTGFDSMVNTGATGLTRKPNTVKTSLLGGA